MPQHPKRPVSELKAAELRTIVGEIQELLWQVQLVDDEQRSQGGLSSFWDANKEGSLDTLAAIAGVLDEHGLRPIEPSAVIGFDSVDEFIKHVATQLPVAEEPDPDDYGDRDDPTDWIGGDVVPR